MDITQQDLRSIGTQIDTYIELLKLTGEHKRRGRRPDPDKVNARIAAIDAELRSDRLRPTKRLVLLGKRDRLVKSIAEPDVSTETLGQLAEAEEAFVAGAAVWAQAKGVNREAFRSLGVPKPVLDEAGL